MHDFMLTACLPPSLEPALAAAAALLSAIAALVAARARTTSEDVQRTLWSQPALDRRSSSTPGPSELGPGVRDRRRSSTKGTTST